MQAVRHYFRTISHFWPSQPLQADYMRFSIIKGTHTGEV